MGEVAYEGRRQGHHVEVVRIDPDGSRHPLTHVIHHSPDGFNWGYSGSGPADLALSILADHLGRRPEPLLYQTFKEAFIANWSGNTWRVAFSDIDTWLRNVELVVHGLSEREYLDGGLDEQ